MGPIGLAVAAVVLAVVQYPALRRLGAWCRRRQPPQNPTVVEVPWRVLLAAGAVWVTEVALVLGAFGTQPTWRAVLLFVLACLVAFAGFVRGTMTYMDAAFFRPGRAAA
jgi:hypothetical protein